MYWLREAAAWRYVKTDQMVDFFNFTMTYRWDSDAVHAYGKKNSSDYVEGMAHL